MRRDNDIKAPDGYTLGGLRLVRADGTILFGRGWWQAPKEWVGERVWVHEAWSDRNEMFLEAAPPGLHIYESRLGQSSARCDRTERRDARPVYRRPERKAWAERAALSPKDQPK